MKFFAVSAAILAAWATAVPLTYEVVPASFSALDSQVVFKSCGGARDSVKMSTITISPDPPIVGQDITITINGRLSRDILPKTIVKLTAYVGIFKVKDTTFDLCTQMGIQCPFKATPGKDQTIVAKMPVDSSIPAGVTITAKLLATNPDDNSPAFCMQGDLEFENGDN